jgi:predicted nucleic acid-binding protein
MPSFWLCVDANLVIRLVADPDNAQVRQLWKQWKDARRQLAAPTLLYYEVANALYRYRKLGILDSSAVREALEAAFALPIELYGGQALHRRAVEWADRFSLPAAYDAHYLALAEQLGGELWTADGRLARALRPAVPWVHLVEPE